MRNRYDPNRDALQVSNIFDWYADDFRVGSYRSVAALMAAHAAQLSNDPQVNARIRARSIDIALLPYDWQSECSGYAMNVQISRSLHRNRNRPDNDQRTSLAICDSVLKQESFP